MIWRYRVALHRAAGIVAEAEILVFAVLKAGIRLKLPARFVVTTWWDDIPRMGHHLTRRLDSREASGVFFLVHDGATLVLLFVASPLNHARTMAIVASIRTA